MTHRIVLDTNCIVSALLFSRAKMSWLRQEWQSGNVIPLVNKLTASELIRVLSYPKFKLNQAEQSLLLADFLPYTETVSSVEVPPHLPIIRDINDQMFLNLAVVGCAEFLVTGDRDLLVIKDTFKTPPILTISEFEVWLKEYRSK
jgi:putative PIN family toxin of toxin-antitoxin system